MHPPVDLDFFNLFDENFSFRLGEFQALALLDFFEVSHHPFERFQRVRHRKHVVSKSQVGYAFFFPSPNVMPKPFSFQVALLSWPVG